MQFFKNPDCLIQALSDWTVFGDPDLLEVVQILEKKTGGKECAREKNKSTNTDVSNDWIFIYLFRTVNFFRWRR